MHKADLIIIGAGPGGYELAARQAAHGNKVILIERDKLGGTCLNRGCIPTKCLCATAQTAIKTREASNYGVITTGAPAIDYGVATDRMHQVVDTLRQGIAQMLKNVEVVAGEATITPDHNIEVNGEIYTAPQIIIATGSRPATLPIEGAELAMSSDEVLAMTTLPVSTCIIGAGVIGMEFASILLSLGVEVTVIEYCKEILPPFDGETAKRLRTMISRRGAKIIVGAAVSAIRKSESGMLAVEYTDKRGNSVSVSAATAIMAVGRKPVVPQGAETAGIELTPRGFIKVDDKMRTTVPGIYAVGDVNGVCMLAHAAAAQGRVAMGEEVRLDVIPSAVFTHPEAAMVGMTEEALKTQETPYAATKAMFAGNGKALAMGEGEGFAKILYSPADGKILGCHIIGPHAADIIAEAAAAMVGNLSIKDLACRLVHGHPTLSEILMTAAEAAE